MPSLMILIDFILHLDKYLNMLVQMFGASTYAILFTVIFAETGLVIAPFLPGDSLLFVCGAFAASGTFNPLYLFILLAIAAILGDALNYQIGARLGPRIFKERNVRFFNKDHLMETQKFYDKHGPKTIVFARFIPVIRTFAPFVAGIGSMSYWRFATYNIAGAIAWVGLFVFSGYYFGNVPIVKENLNYVILIIIFASFVPPVIDYVKHKMEKDKG
ncbi:MAG: DedA family protein [Nanoarchaeota archaeon]